MILYFSATGNTRFVAATLAKELDDECVDLAKRMHAGDTSPLSSSKPFVLCFPVYVDCMPMPVYRHVRSTLLQGSREAYAVVTMGSYEGIAGRQAQELFESKGMAFRGWDSVVMPRNYIVGLFPDEKADSIKNKLAEAPDKVARIASTISRGELAGGHRVPTYEYLLVLPFVRVWDRIGFPTKKFAVNEKCVSCGMCERLCPVSAIRMEQGLPVWEKRHCMHCMACIQNCPKAAIEYGKALQKKRRYRFALYGDLVNGK